MRSRKLPITYDYLSPRESYLLNTTLSDYLPQLSQPSIEHEHRLSSILKGHQQDLPQSHHLVFFPPSMPNSQTIPDGTDPFHSPRGLFTRRMWVGGDVHFNNNPLARLQLDGLRAACLDRVIDASVKKKQSKRVTFCGRKAGEHKWTLWAEAEQDDIEAKAEVITEEAKD
jgi:hypothetical protein